MRRRSNGDEAAADAEFKELDETMSESLSVHVYVAPMRPFVGAWGDAGDRPMWSPMSSTLIAGEDEAILVDTLVANEQVDKSAFSPHRPAHRPAHCPVARTVRQAP